MQDILTITVGLENADLSGSTNTVIQVAIDRVAALGGGIVKILPGKFIMKDSLHMRSGVTIEGSGGDTVLLKAPSISSPLVLDLGYGHFDVSVVEPRKFETGMGIRVSDDDSGGFYNTVSTITAKQGNELIINRMLNHDYSVCRNGRAVSVFPVISGYYIENACIRNLAIDGNASENEYIDGCRGGGVFLLQGRNIRIRNVTVRNYNGDAISFQQCINTLVEDCTCMDNTGSGLHPGSGSVGVTMRNILSKNNGGDGIFYCLRVSYSLCEDCTFEGNKGMGISIGHRDTDAIIRNNKILGNGGCGVYFRQDALNKSGSRTLLTENSFSGNCTVMGKSEIFFDSIPENVYIYRNIGIDRKDIKAVHDDYLAGVCCGEPKTAMNIGPAYVSDKASLHLGILNRNR